MDKSIMDEMCNITAKYEDMNHIPDEERITEYVARYGRYMYKVKNDMTSQSIEETYQKAKRELNENNAPQDDIVAVFTITLKHNLSDSELYSLKNSSLMIKKFFETEAVEKKIGIKKKDGTIIYLIREIQDREYPEFVNTFGCEEFIENFKHEWFTELVKKKEEFLIKQTKAILDNAQSQFSSKQKQINYEKEIKRKMEIARKFFRDERMEGYDFRQIDLQDAIFINCELTKANFSHVMLQNTIFINCNLNDAVFYGANLNNAYLLNGNLEKLVDCYEWISQKRLED